MRVKPTLWIMPASFFVALVLALWPLPDLLALWRPDWVALVLLYWALAPGRGLGPVLPWSIGVLVDVQTGMRLGLHALGFCLIVAMAEVMHRRLKVFSLWQTGMAVAILLMVLRLVVWLGSSLGTHAGAHAIDVLPVFSGALVWPLVVVLLRRAEGMSR